MLNRRFFLMAFLTFLVTACSGSQPTTRQIIVGVLSYGESASTLEKYQGFRDYLAKEFNSVVLLEPSFNEVQAVQQIIQKSWDVVISPPGLAAIAISQSQYSAVLPRIGADKTRSILVVKDNSDINDIKELNNQSVALGHEGSATSYYFPIYNLYGLTLSEIKFAPTPKTVLEWVDTGEVTAGALSQEEFENLKGNFESGFKILFRDTHPVPAGAILVSPDRDEAFKADLIKALEKAPLDILETVGFVPNAQPPDYSYLIQVVKRVRPIAKRVKEKPAPIY
ncbi:MAG: phosphate/phosphite/phosphonate ABC transporter substrate-binding protein [Acaryochloridaceae cyanobacterium RL_2_7]|nr:phosphate/phosphite/phosphonate ABC transporter substrate-binding protein [Acaryochloridaceae cyanobacterium RL_2_7]